MQTIIIAYACFALVLALAAYCAGQVNAARVAQRRALAAMLKPGIKPKDAEKIVAQLYAVPGRWGAAEFIRLSTIISKALPATHRDGGHAVIRRA